MWKLPGKLCPQFLCRCCVQHFVLCIPLSGYLQNAHSEDTWLLNCLTWKEQITSYAGPGFQDDALYSPLLSMHSCSFLLAAFSVTKSGMTGDNPERERLSVSGRQVRSNLTPGKHTWSCSKGMMRKEYFLVQSGLGLWMRRKKKKARPDHLVMKGAVCPTSSCSTSSCGIASLTRTQWGKYDIREAFMPTINSPLLESPSLVWAKKPLSLRAVWSGYCLTRDWFTFPKYGYSGNS